MQTILQADGSRSANQPSRSGPSASTTSVMCRRVTLDEALELFLVQLQADGRSSHTVGQYRRHVRLLASWLPPSVRVEEIGHESLARFLASPQARTRSDGSQKKPGSANALRSSLKGFFAYAHEAGYIAQNPARLIRRARGAHRR